MESGSGAKIVFSAPLAGRCFVLLTLCLLAVVGCAPEALLNPPRQLTQTVQAQLAKTPLATPAPPQVEVMPSSTPATLISADSVTVELVAPLVVWINETSPAHREAAQKIGAAFESQTGKPVAFQFVPSLSVGVMAEAASRNGTLPDVILHSHEQIGDLLEAQILDVETATAISAELNLNSVANQLYPLGSGQIPSLPSDGFQYLLFYRSDWLENLFFPPQSFADLETIASTFHNFDDEDRPADAKLVAGIALPTEQDLPSTQRIFEWFAIANGCELVDEKGEVLLTQPACGATLDYYKRLVFNYSPPDFQTRQTVLNAYIDGRTAMMIGSPHDIPTIAGANAAKLPTCAECLDNPSYLAANTGIMSQMTGITPTIPVSMSYARMVGITVGADVEAAAFARFWFTDGYLDWLAVTPESKVPFYEPAIAAWRALPSSNGTTAHADLLPGAVDIQLAQIAAARRWGIPQGQGQLLSEIYAQKPLLGPLVLRYLGGLVTIEQSTNELRNAVADTIPLYPYYPTPTPQPTDKP